MDTPDLLREEYTIDTPENVTFGYDVAGIGSRFIGAIIDTLLILVLLFLLNLLLGVVLAYALDSGAGSALAPAEEPEWLAGVVIAVYALLNFAVLWGYYLAFELRWDGRTPGKRVAGTQVVKVDGSPAGFSESAIRNLVRIVDFLPMAYAIGVITMFFNRQARRLGDFAAGTLVVKQRSEIRLDALGDTAPRPRSRTQLPGTAASTAGTAHEAAAEAALLQFPTLRRLTGADYQVVRDTLARHDQGGVDPHLLHRLAVVIAARLQVEPPPHDWVKSRWFLVQVADAYRALGEQEQRPAG